MKFYRPFQFALISIVLFSGCATADNYVTTTDGIDIAYEFKKAKSPRGNVLLVHGLGSNLDAWYRLGKQLRKAGWNTMAIDLRGHGMSNYIGDEEFRWSDLSDSLLNAATSDLDAAWSKMPALEENWVIGASFGANIAFNWSSQNTNVDGLVLLSPSLNYAGVMTWNAAKKMQSLPIMFLTSQEDYRAFEGSTDLFNKVPGPKALKVYPGEAHANQLLDEIKDLDKEIIAWMENPVTVAK